jgi:Fe2+ transport system protein FeoA
MSKKLSRCVQGDTIRIVRVNAGGIIKKRLLEMGFMKGDIVEIVKYAPLKDPMEVEIKGFHVSLRVSEAECIEVEQI